MGNGKIPIHTKGVPAPLSPAILFAWEDPVPHAIPVKLPPGLIRTMPMARVDAEGPRLPARGTDSLSKNTIFGRVNVRVNVGFFKRKRILLFKKPTFTRTFTRPKMMVFDRESVPLAGKRGPSASTRPEPSRGLVLGPVKVPRQRPICWRNILINNPCLSHAHVHIYM